MGQIVTFYSYKGGVGRTMALANVAVLLARWGYKTLIVDWDLEAPGLENFFKDYIDLKSAQMERGVIDLLENPAGDVTQSAELSNWQEFIVRIKVPGSNQPLHLLTAGKRDEHYFRKVRAFDVQAFYSEKNGGFFIELLRDEWKGAYDFVLIDSRTGITDIGGICTIQLPDVLVLIFTATEQSLDGILDIAKKASQARQKLPVERFNLLCVPIPSRFDATEQFQISQKWLDKFSSDLSELYADWLPKEVNKRDIIEITKIPYVSYFSFGEKLAVLEQGTVDPAGLGYAFESLASMFANNLENVDQLLKGRDEYIRQASKREPRTVKSIDESEEIGSLNADALEAHREWLESHGAQGKRIDLRSSKLSRVNLASAVLRKALLTCTEFLGAYLYGADLSGADLSGADFLGADLSEAHLSSANLLSAKLTRAKLTRADLRYADLRDADLSGADFSNADLSNTDLTEAIFNNAILREANLNGANLTRAHFSGADLSRTGLANTTLYGIDFSEANLSQVNLAGAKLTFTNLSEANLSQADLSGANLTRANLYGANLAQADLSGANLTRAILSNASLVGTNLNGAILNGANLTGTDLRGFGLDTILNLSEEQIASAIIDDEVQRFLRWRVGLRANLEYWKASSKSEGRLLRGISLATSAEFLRTSAPYIDEEERRYIRKSIMHNRGRQLFMIAAGIIITFFVALLGLRACALSPEAISLKLAQAAQSKMTDDPQLGAELALEAVKASPIPQAVALLRASLYPFSLKAENTGEEVMNRPGGVLRDCVFTSDARMLFASINGNTVWVWQSGTGANPATLKGHSSQVINAVFSPDGKFVVTCGDDRTARVWNISTAEELVALRGHSESVLFASFSPDGKFVVTASADKTARVWDIRTAQERVMLRGHAGWVYKAAFSPDGKFVVTSGGDNTAQVWNVNTGESILTLGGHTAGVLSSAFSPDGKLIVTGSVDNKARVWNAATGEFITELEGHTGAVTKVAFSPNGLFILTASNDKTARLWAAGTYETVAVLRANTAEVKNAVFNSEGNLVVTTCNDGSARLYSSELSGSADDLIKLADKFGLRPVTPQEREKYIRGNYDRLQ